MQKNVSQRIAVNNIEQNITSPTNIKVPHMMGSYTEGARRAMLLGCGELAKSGH